ncbi:hypothetical protein [Aequorivita antarctica]|uniref:DUF3395 domain-containing protein n=1 Tax=Aequorivita antarctica TaxID=153266 RepID=A0A5C6Z3Z5_9FLAO|nr:hypothetical protein [Aequorivita antarctica]TXD74246.1 DUF3395 domain-containing protein [Aequorivita antarctica]SRX73584.1 hypothetical protein AEQU3_01016 [Aequorivita antarctica]
MKKLMMSLAVAVLSIAGIQAQVNKSIKEESTTKRVITRDGSDVKVMETKDIDTESGALIIEDSNKIDRNFSEVTKEDSDKKVLVDEVYVDAQNEAMIAEKKKQQQAQLEASKKEQAEIAAKKKMEYEAKQAQMQKELAERRAQLESRPKGMSKLKKD